MRRAVLVGDDKLAPSDSDKRKALTCVSPVCTALRTAEDARRRGCGDARSSPASTSTAGPPRVWVATHRYSTFRLSLSGPCSSRVRRVSEQSREAWRPVTSAPRARADNRIPR